MRWRNEPCQNHAIASYYHPTTGHNKTTFTQRLIERSLFLNQSHLAYSSNHRQLSAKAVLTLPTTLHRPLSTKSARPTWTPHLHYRTTSALYSPDPLSYRPGPRRQYLYASISHSPAPHSPPPSLNFYSSYFSHVRALSPYAQPAVFVSP